MQNISKYQKGKVNVATVELCFCLAVRMASTLFELVLIFKNWEISNKIQASAFPLKITLRATLWWEPSHGCPCGQDLRSEGHWSPHHSLVFLFHGGQGPLSFSIDPALLFYLQLDHIVLFLCNTWLNPWGHLCLHHHQKWHIHFLCLRFE